MKLDPPINIRYYDCNLTFRDLDILHWISKSTADSYHYKMFGAPWIISKELYLFDINKRVDSEFLGRLVEFIEENQLRNKISYEGCGLDMLIWQVEFSLAY